MTTCNHCNRTWTTTGEAHCASCCQHFTSDRSFDTHLAAAKSDDDCYDPATITRKDGRPMFETVMRASGVMWGIANPQQHSLDVSQQLPEPLEHAV